MKLLLLALLGLPAPTQDALAKWHRLDQEAPSQVAAAPTAQERAQDALPLVPWQKAAEHVGETVIVTGKVVRTYDSGKATFLNYDQDWKGKFSAVIFASTACEFPEAPATLLLDRELRIRGKIKMYKGAPEIVIDSPRQVMDAEGNPLFPTAAAADEGPRAAPRVAKGSAGVRLMSWNLENFFDRYDDPFTRDEVTSPAFVAPARMQRIADAIHAVNPDVLALQEVENRPLLEAFNRDYLADLGYEVVLVEGNDTRGIDVALLSRLPVEEVTSYRHLRFADAEGEEQHFQRDLLRVRIGGRLQADVYVVHLKSQHGGAAADLVREAEAAAAVSILGGEMAVDKGYRAAIVGDFNEVVDMPTIQAFLQAGLVDPCAGTEKYTYNKRPYLTRIDFALVTPGLAKDLQEGKVLDKLEGMSLTCATDHFPVVLELAAATRPDESR
jgi:endonuclease/exonuclease/phosphatase family metal-dependent hydrolase/DNA/RNA endonuclease YhcR with UshA esterase domain